ncbi:MAG: hypothetical protein A2X58_04480 [Nitrospirae bacterium GWC2_56_14]|nr:MAG: hypothetical protein A2X58_04480 [Nitrospirae bacterium GWC2_56_14]
MYYEKIFSALQKGKVRYAVAGGVALVLHGVVRFTADLDLIVDLERENLGRFIAIMKELGYLPRNPVKADELLAPESRAQWKREKNMEVFSFYAPAQPMELIDVFIEEKFPFEDIIADMLVVTAKGVMIPVVSLRHLKKLKKAAGRPQDLADIEALEALERTEEKE